jgi:hypothetical protein
MSAVVERPAAPAPASARAPTPLATRWLLAGGAAAGPLFLAIAGIQVLTVDGFDLGRHPLSLLSVGEHGWIQIANFVLAGVLTLGLAVGLRRVWRSGRGRTWGPLLIGLYGAGLVAGGVFVADPALGFPPGTPDGIPTSFSWHAAVHSVAPVVAFNAVIVAGIVYAVRFAGLRERGWAASSAATAVGALVCAAWPNQDTVSWRLAIAITLVFAWQTALALKASRA